ncbi:MAG: phosphate regulon sensor histidine kinase PhoR [Burkholderiaceae bacterium]|nr:phosphate regulon sensor histidine kinase PhoR [Burkholderiaceae bacterium]
MFRRTVELLSLTLAGGWLFALLGQSEWAPILGCLSGAFLWTVWDNVRANRVLSWLRDGSASRAPTTTGVWEEVVDRARKSFKTLNRRARKSDARLQEFLAALQASPNGVVMLDRNANIEWCNFTAAQHLGFDPKRDLYQQIRNLVRDPAFIAFLTAGDYSESVEIDGRDAAPGHPHRISIYIHVYGKGRRLMLTRDVTALEQAEAMRRDFVANVSHEIRTPLTVVSGFIETLLSLPLSEEDRLRYLRMMEAQAQRMQGLVSDLLTLSRLEGSPMPGMAEWFSASELLHQAMDEARALSDVLSGGLHQLTLLDGPSLELAGARSELASAITNLLNNAVRHTPAGSTVKAGWRLDDDGGAELVVEDDGPGIAPEHLPRLTERFYRVDRSRSRETGGTGLGLAIVKHVAQRHGGQMRVHSTPGKGSTFVISLPPSRVKADE